MIKSLDRGRKHLNRQHVSDYPLVLHCNKLSVLIGACIFRPTSRVHFHILNINTSHSNLRQEATNFKCNRLGSHIKTVKNWMLQLSHHCFTHANWKLNAVINTQIFKHNKLKIECCIQQSILPTVKNWMLQPSNHYLTQTHWKLNVSTNVQIFNWYRLKVKCYI